MHEIEREKTNKQTVIPLYIVFYTVLQKQNAEIFSYGLTHWRLILAHFVTAKSAELLTSVSCIVVYYFTKILFDVDWADKST